MVCSVFSHRLVITNVWSSWVHANVGLLPNESANYQGVVDPLRFKLGNHECLWASDSPYSRVGSPAKSCHPSARQLETSLGLVSNGESFPSPATSVPRKACRVAGNIETQALTQVLSLYQKK